jgi:drug/metabolite transporter (DMT)-like permease
VFLRAIVFFVFKNSSRYQNIIHNLIPKYNSSFIIPIMFSILISVLATTWIFILFKLFPKYGVNTFQAIVINYLTACICGISLYGNTLTKAAFEHTSWIPFVFLCGILFISIFYLMGLSSQRNGVSITSVAVKMSMAISMGLMIFIYQEEITWIKVAGIILSILGVIIMSYERKQLRMKKVTSEESRHSLLDTRILLLIAIFLGCGLLDVVLNYVQSFHLQHLSTSLFSAFGLGMAGIFGGIVMLVNNLRKKEKVEKKSILAGILLGIPNYFSIYYLIKSYSSTPWSDSTVLAVLNVTTVITSTLAGLVLFKEKLNLQKSIGLVLSLLAIACFYFAK